MKQLGIVGAGIIGISHRNAIKNNKDSCLAAVCDVVAKKAQSLVEGTDVPIYTDYRKMAQEVALDGVILNLPHFLHKEVTIYFLERKIAVLVEKPMANSATEQLGKLCLVTESRNIYYFSEERPKWFCDKAKAGGGIAMNYGAHSIDKLLYTTGATIERVCANGNNMLNDANVEAAAQILLKLSNGASASLSYSGCYSPYSEEVCFYFTEGVAKVCGNRELWISEKGKPFERMNLDYTKMELEEQLAEFNKCLSRYRGTYDLKHPLRFVYGLKGPS